MIDTIATRAVDQNEKVLTDLAKKIWENPETAFNEVKACEWTAEVLRNAGFEVETGYVGMPTAIRAVWGKGHPVIGFLGEYDALPGLSQKVSTEKEPVTPGAAGQGCGHNLLGCCLPGRCSWNEGRAGGHRQRGYSGILWLSGRGGPHRKGVYGKRRSVHRAGCSVFLARLHQ